MVRPFSPHLVVDPAVMSAAGTGCSTADVGDDRFSVMVGLEAAVDGRGGGPVLAAGSDVQPGSDRRADVPLHFVPPCVTSDGVFVLLTDDDYDVDGWNRYMVLRSCGVPSDEEGDMLPELEREHLQAAVRVAHAILNDIGSPSITVPSSPSGISRGRGERRGRPRGSGRA
ncbi:hypothetical protein Dimus_029167 [Dionaea muscipula]